MTALLKTVTKDHLPRFAITDTADGEKISVQLNVHKGFTDVVLLEGQHGLTIADLVHSGALLI